MEIFVLAFFIYIGYLIISFLESFNSELHRNNNIENASTMRKSPVIQHSTLLPREYFKNTPKDIRSMDWREFEFFIASLFKEKGYVTTLTPAENDGGKDVIAEKDGITYFIECKHWQQNGIVGRELLQKLVGSAVGYGVKHAIFIATCQYNNNAKEYAIKTRKNGFDIQLWGLDDILNFCSSYPSILLYSIIEQENLYIKKPIATLKNMASQNINKDIESLLSNLKNSASASKWSFVYFSSETKFENLYIITISITQCLVVQKGHNFPESNSKYDITYDKRTGLRKT